MIQPTSILTQLACISRCLTDGSIPQKLGLYSCTMVCITINIMYAQWETSICLLVGTINMMTLMHCHYDDVIMGGIASQITSLTIVYSTVYSGADQSKHQSSASLAFVWGIHRGPVNSPRKWPVTRKMLPFDDVIMYALIYIRCDIRLIKIHMTSYHKQVSNFISIGH